MTLMIMQAKETVIFHDGEEWRKKDTDNGLFDITMGSLDGAESCELVVCYLLSQLQNQFGRSIGLYRDDGIAILKGTRVSMGGSGFPFPTVFSSIFPFLSLIHI